MKGLIYFLSIMIFLSFPLLGTEKETQEREEKNRISQQKNLILGEQFRTGKEIYVFLPELKSRKSQGKKEAGKNVDTRSLREEVWAEKGGFVFFKTDEVNKGNSLIRQNKSEENTYSVVLNKRTRQYGGSYRYSPGKVPSGENGKRCDRKKIFFNAGASIPSFKFGILLCRLRE